MSNRYRFILNIGKNSHYRYGYDHKVLVPLGSGAAELWGQTKNHHNYINMYINMIHFKIYMLGSPRQSHIDFYEEISKKKYIKEVMRV